tara:strand:- start:563 stop:697 length:135 start_codon:yes stop_codon:yes gene_type:complete
VKNQTITHQILSERKEDVGIVVFLLRTLTGRVHLYPFTSGGIVE